MNDLDNFLKELEKEDQMRSTLYVLLNDIRYKIRSLRFYIQSVLIRKDHLLDLRNQDYKYGYLDEDYRLLYANFNILKEFVESAGYKHIDWDSDVGYYQAHKEFEELYKWWTRDSSYEPLDILGDANYNKETEMLVRLVKLRKYMWS
jgi:hypothetical protein